MVKEATDKKQQNYPSIKEFFPVQAAAASTFASTAVGREPTGSIAKAFAITSSKKRQRVSPSADSGSKQVGRGASKPKAPSTASASIENSSAGGGGSVGSAEQWAAYDRCGIDSNIFHFISIFLKPNAPWTTHQRRKKRNNNL